MAEMLLLSKEAVRRRKSVNLNKANAVVTNSGAKPLSLEYLADRMDVDEVGLLFSTIFKADAMVTRKKQKSNQSSDVHHSLALLWIPCPHKNQANVQR